MDIDPTQHIDYCSVGCDPAGFAVTPWAGETCGCCGGSWGEGGGTCRGVHVTGAVWTALLDTEIGRLDIVTPSETPEE